MTKDKIKEEIKNIDKRIDEDCELFMQDKITEAAFKENRIRLTASKQTLEWVLDIMYEDAKEANKEAISKMF